ncbi:MAG: hypothetical protein HZA61_14830 [Candidatus Eisenbacteria bacterium]|uniref:DUF885 domain-containing protein n=1 Tax=Eiseniibacteriota bacterium TaxID=2212470 RepID=A0A933SDW2_UNCEI|nr:hypothetical protein [Candidatus Eisenbacteria bacterium]
MTIRRTPALLLSTTALALLCAGASSSVAGPGAADASRAALVRARAQWREWVREQRPDLAAGVGVAVDLRRAAPLDEAGLDSARVRVARVRGTLARVDRAALPAAEAVAFDTLEARAGRESDLLESGAWRRDPGLYAAFTLEAALEAAAPRKGLSPCERSRRALLHLRRTSEALRAARVNLGRAGTAGGDHAGAFARWEDAIRRARTELPAVFLACREPHRLADAVEADSAAIAAAERFVREVREEFVHSARAR